MSRSMLTMIHADDFYPEEEATNLFHAIYSVKFQPSHYGNEIPNFKLTSPALPDMLSDVLGESVKIDKERSGSFRQPMFGIHFEDFKHVEEWCFIVALEPTTFNVFHHKSGAKDARYGHMFNYKNPFEWGDAITNIELKRNQGLFFRPWLFHSLDKGIIQYIRVQPESLPAPEQESIFSCI